MSGYQISIAQSKYLKEMYDDIIEMPLRKVCLGKDKIYIFDQKFAKHLFQFGKAPKKFIPDTIKNLPPEDIRIFLDAFRLGDGSVRKGNGWKGIQFKDSSLYHTSSNRMAGELGELIIKVGKSVSYRLNKTKGRVVKFKNGTYKINNDCWTVYELSSRYRLFSNIRVKEVEYNDFVYDVEVEKNHTLLVRRNGKVAWGSNCRCTTIPVLFGEKTFKPPKVESA